MRSSPGCRAFATSSCSGSRSPPRPAAPSLSFSVPPRPRARPRRRPCASPWNRRAASSSCASPSGAAPRRTRRCACRSRRPPNPPAMLWIALHFRQPPPGTIEPIAAWACQFTPRISPEGADALLAEVSGSLRYFGGAPALLATLRAGLEELALDASVATARTPRAALWLARAEGSAGLDAVPLEATRWELDFFRSIRVATLGRPERLPRPGLARRCPPQVPAELDCAFGRREEPRRFFLPPQRFDARLELPAEVAHAEALAFAARRLLVQLAGLLAARHAGIRAF